MKQSAVKTIAIKYIFCVLAVCLLCCCQTTGKYKFTRKELENHKPSTIKIAGNLDAQRDIMLAYAKAYPDRVSSVEFINDDWTMLVNNKRFYYANGRFLPEELRDKWEEYDPYDFYDYPWTGTDRQRRLEFEYPIYSSGSSFLLDALYNSTTENESWGFQEKYTFLGVKLLINSYIKNKLDRISALIQEAALGDPSINEWIAELQTGPVTLGWFWRRIANTNRRSTHSYGIAIDLLPRDLKGRLTYWQWEASDTVNSEIYYMPPKTVIKIFEDHGFIWGGSWGLIDTMHFEYRPEILLMNNFSVIP